MINCLSIGIEQRSGNLDIQLGGRYRLSPRIEQISEFEMNISLVCSVGKDYYLRVEPKTVWVTDDMIKELLIKSNVKWTIN